MSIFEDAVPPGLVSALSDLEKQFITMRSSGAPIRDIAKKLKKSTHTICDWNRKYRREILSLRNSEFCELQKKIIELKTSRIDFLKDEIKRISAFLRKEKIADFDFQNNYDSLLERYIKLSDLISNYENDMLRVGVNFRENIEPEANLIVDDNNVTPDNKESFNNTVSAKNNKISPENAGQTIEKKEFKIVEKQNCNNTTLPKKFSHKKQ